MKTNNLLIVCLLLASTTIAQQKVIQLYDGPVPGSEAWTWTEAENNDNMWETRVVYNISKPTLTVFAPDPAKANGTAIIIAPGGAFHALSIDSEGYDAAKWLANKGVTCFVLKYRIARSLTTDPVKEVMGKWGKPEFDEENAAVIPLGIADGREAIAYVRKHAAEYNVLTNRIGIMGFSAGGTVTSGTLFNYSKENRPDFAAPIYPFFPKDMIGTIGKDAPPLFILTASDDGLDLAPHSVDLYSAWLGAKKDVELHMYARGDHGFGMRTQNLPTDKWIERFDEWLGVQGLLKAPDPTLKPYQRKEFTMGENTLPYRILYPDNYDKTKKYPLIMFLHGSGERDNDNEKQLGHGGRLFMTDASMKATPAIVIFPQCPEDASWVSINVDRSVDPPKFNIDYSKEPQWPLVAANELVKRIASEEAVDKSRIYISGLSLGGLGTFESVYRYPDLYAAALPICGGGDAKSYDSRVKKTAFWIFHGDADQAVPVTLSREMQTKLKALKVETRYSEYPGVAHNSWDNAFAEPEYVKWMLAHKRK